MSVGTAIIDFETYSPAGFRWDAGANKWRSLEGVNQTERGLKVVGSRAYIEHEGFEPLTLAYKLNHMLHEWVFGTSPDPTLLFDHIAAGGLVEAWKADFEYDVWNLWCVPRLGWPTLPAAQMRCTMSRARAAAYPGKLSEAGKVLQLKIQKDADGDRLLKKFSVPRNPTKADPSLRLHLVDDMHDAVRLIEYNKTDVLSEEEAATRLPELSEFELAVWQADQRINQRGVQIDVESLEACISIYNQANEKYTAELYSITGGVLRSAAELEQMRVWLHAHGVPLPNMQEETIEETLKTLAPGLPRRVLEIRVALASASVKKLFSIRAQLGKDGRLHHLYAYAGARTKRWNGMGPQPMNLPKAGPLAEWNIEAAEQALAVIRTRNLESVERVYGDALLAISGCLRALFIAAPGHDLVCSDFSNIEGVVLAALAGEEWRLEVFRTHGLIYEASASAITGIPFEEFIQHKKDTGKHHPMRNKIGKFAELGSGFGGWISAWKNFGADEFLSDDEIKEALLAWRAASPNIVEFWGGQQRGWGYRARPELFGIEGAAVAAIQTPGQAYEYKGHVFQMNGDALYLRLLSGSFLTYHEPRLTPGGKHGGFNISYLGWNSNPKMGPLGWVRMNAYGGKFTENIVQHTARDIHANGILNLERSGYPVVLHTHDEPAAEVREGAGSIEQLEYLMCMITPATEFCRPWPIKAKGGWRGKRYRKD